MNIEIIEKILNRFYAPFAGSGHKPCAKALKEAIDKEIQRITSNKPQGDDASKAR